MPPKQLETATLAGGCFWCLEAVFDDLKGVKSVESGYMGGNTPNPNYEQVCSGTSGHAEVVRVTFDPAQLGYRDLLSVFFAIHDPTTLNRQGNDAGTQYRSAIFYHSEEQKRLAEASKAKWEKAKPFKQPILTPITQAGDFWPAEEYHQDYYKKNPVQYRFYVTGCGRYARLDQLWGALRKQ